MKISRALLLALFLGFGLICFCVGRAAKANDGYSLTLREANEHKILLITVGSEPRTLDPQEAQGVTEHHIIMAMIEGLVAPSIDDQSKVVPGMASAHCGDCQRVAAQEKIHDRKVVRRQIPDDVDISLKES